MINHRKTFSPLNIEFFLLFQVFYRFKTSDISSIINNQFGMKNIAIVLGMLVMVSGLHFESSEVDKHDQRMLYLRTNHVNSQIQQGERIKIICLIGGPGTGKSSNSRFLQAVFGFKHISLGELFRKQLANNSSISSQLKAIMDEGKLVPSEIGINLIKNELQKLKPGETVLLDGFPRNVENLQTWDRIIGERFKLKTFLHSVRSLQLMKQKLLKRGQISGRSDDNPETIEKRLQVFLDETSIVIKQIEQCRECQVIKIDSNRQAPLVRSQVEGIFLGLGYKPFINSMEQ